MIKKIACAIIFGLIVSILMLQRDQAIHRALGAYCTNLFRDYLECNMCMKVKSINLFTGSIIFEGVRASDAQSHDWAWRCNELIISFSLWELLPHGKLVAHMQFNDISAKTTIHNGAFGIVPHIIKAMYGFSPDIPLLLRTITFHHACLSGRDDQYDIDAFVSGDSRLLFGDQACQAVFNFIDGCIEIRKQEFVSMIDGVINLAIPYYNKNWSVGADLRGHVPQLEQPGVNCFCAGNIQSGVGSFAVKSINDSLTTNSISCDLQTKGVVSAQINAPLNLMCAIVMQQPSSEKIKGNGRLAFTYNFYEEPYLQGNIACSDLSYNNFHCASHANLIFAQDSHGWHGSVDCNYNEALGFHGNWSWLNGKKGILQLTNNVPLLPAISEPWEIPPDSVSVSCSIDPQGRVKAKLQGVANNKKTNQHVNIAGTINVDEHEAAAHGTIEDQKYDAAVWLSPIIGLKELRCAGPQKSYIQLKGKESDHRLFSGSIDFPSLIGVIEKIAGLKLEGEGKINLYGIIDYPRLALKTKFSQGAIRLPHIYNCINNFEITGSLDAAHQIKLSSLDCTLYEGALHCKNACALFDDHWRPLYIYVPLIADHCLLNEKKDLFTLISGNMVFQKNGAESPQLAGNLILHRSHFADTALSGAFGGIFSHSQNVVAHWWADLQCNLQIETEHPIHIKTTLLDAQAKAAIQLKGMIHSPEVSGTISLDGGSILFPYKPLYITKGVVIINGQQLDDPFIELVAKNTIKKYLISLNAQGTLNHNEINFSSNPPLKDEQIIGLLFAGSEEESLKSIAPALVMSNIKQLLFGSDPNSLAHRYLDPALKPFSYVHFIPSFSDQSGRGGMRGTFEIDINDRWRAMIQKNFNLSEDTHVELEYLLSDEISLKGIRDEHRDISSEVEMRFKF